MTRVRPSNRVAIFAGLMSATVIQPVFATDECGGAAGAPPTVTCTDTSLNDYASGITYITTGGLVMDVAGGIQVDRSQGQNFYAIDIQNANSHDVKLTLRPGVVLQSSGLNAHTVHVSGGGNISIESSATISFSTDPLGVGNFNYTAGLNGRTNFGTGNVEIVQNAGSTIKGTGIEAAGIHGINVAGTGSVAISAFGVIEIDGDAGIGILSFNDNNALAGNTHILLGQPGSISTKGTSALGLYSLNEGSGNATIDAHGIVYTLDDESDGVVAAIDNALNANGKTEILLSATSVVETQGIHAKGARSINRGGGEAILKADGRVTTSGNTSVGLEVEIQNALNSADLILALRGTGVVQTSGALAHGLSATHEGTGLATVNANAGTSIVVSGTEAFGVNLKGGGAVVADLRGIVSASGEFGVGASAQSTGGAATMTVGSQSVVMGGWQATLNGTGPTTKQPSAGVLIGGSSAVLANFGTIGAASDRAIADVPALNGNNTVMNSGRITGFVALKSTGTNSFTNAAGGIFDLRHFADTDGDGTRDTKRVAISDFGTSATSSLTNAAGAVIRLAPVVGNTAVDAASTYVPTTGAAPRPLDASFYDLTRAGVVQARFNSLGTFSNAGVIDLRGPAIGNVLVMTGAPGPVSGMFVSNSGHLLLNTTLNAGIPLGGQIGSFSDVLVVDGTSVGSGATTITIDRREGVGALTPGNGVMLVEVRDKAASAPGVFALNGDFLLNGDQAVVRGLYAYRLFHNGVGADAADGNWYLRSAGLTPGLPIYEHYPRVLLPLIDMPSLQQRDGNRYWVEKAAPQEPLYVFCKDPEYDYRCPVPPEYADYFGQENSGDGSVVTAATGLRGRLVGSYASLSPTASSTGSTVALGMAGIDIGADGMLAESELGSFVAGAALRYRHAGASISGGTLPGGAISTHGYGLGGNLTWYGTSGFYLDAQGQIMWFDSTLSSAALGQLIHANKGFGYGVSLEAGQRLALDENWALIPQGQMIYSNAGFDAFTDAFGATVALGEGASLRGRLGLAAEYQSSWIESGNSVSRASGYGIVNVYKAFHPQTRVTVSGLDLTSQDASLSAGIGLGGTYSWENGKYALHAETTLTTPLPLTAASYELQGNVGMKVKW